MRVEEHIAIGPLGTPHEHAVLELDLLIILVIDKGMVGNVCYIIYVILIYI